MGFGNGKYAKIWKLEDKGNYHVAEMSTSKKDKTTEKYETDWSNKFVRLIGDAHKQALTIDTSKNVKIGSCEVTSKYDKEKQTTYTNYLIFSFEQFENRSEGNSTNVNDGFVNVPEGIDDDLPFAQPNR